MENPACIIEASFESGRHMYDAFLGLFVYWAKAWLSLELVFSAETSVGSN
jgi:hypothetical protein